MAYKTKAEKKAFRAGMKYQKKRGQVYQVYRTDGKRESSSYFYASSREDARRRALVQMKKNPDVFADHKITAVVGRHIQ